MSTSRALPNFFDRWRQGWSKPDLIGPKNYLDNDDALKVVIMSQWLFAPDLIEIKGGFFRFHDAIEENVDHWLARPDLTVTDVESVVNHVHLYDIFGNCDIDGLDDSLDDLAQSIGSAWRGVLRDRFPERTFTVVVDDTAAGDYGPTVTFFCQRDGSP